MCSQTFVSSLKPCAVDLQLEETWSLNASLPSAKSSPMNSASWQTPSLFCILFPLGTAQQRHRSTYRHDHGSRMSWERRWAQKRGGSRKRQPTGPGTLAPEEAVAVVDCEAGGILPQKWFVLHSSLEIKKKSSAAFIIFERVSSGATVGQDWLCKTESQDNSTSWSPVYINTVTRWDRAVRDCHRAWAW